MKKFVSKSVKETINFGKRLGRILRKGDVVALCGELGSGKTRFIQGFAKGLGLRQRLTSPTFVLLKKYKNLYHIDCYRLNKPKNLLDLDFKEIISNSQNIVLIEWAEKVRSMLPKDVIWVKFEIVSEKKRRIKII